MRCRASVRRWPRRSTTVSAPLACCSVLPPPHPRVRRNPGKRTGLADAAPASTLSSAQAAAYNVLCERFGGELLHRLSGDKLSEMGAAKGAVGWRLALPQDHTGQRRELRFVIPELFPA